MLGIPENCVGGCKKNLRLSRQKPMHRPCRHADSDCTTHVSYRCECQCESNNSVAAPLQYFGGVASQRLPWETDVMVAIPPCGRQTGRRRYPPRRRWTGRRDTPRGRWTGRWRFPPMGDRQEGGHTPRGRQTKGGGTPPPRETDRRRRYPPWETDRRRR